MMHAYAEPQAVLVANQQIKVQIPQGIHPGDTFIHTLNDGRVINVMVPDDSYYQPGHFIEIIIPDDIPVNTSRSSNSNRNAQNGSADNNFLVVPKATAGAALLGSFTIMNKKKNYLFTCHLHPFISLFTFY